MSTSNVAQIALSNPQQQRMSTTSSNVAQIALCNPQQLCAHQRRDLFFHVLFGDDVGTIAELICCMAQRAYLLTECDDLRCIQNVLDDPYGVGRDTLKALFILLANMDMPVKEYACNPGSVEKLRAALNWDAKTALRGKNRQAREEAQAGIAARELAYANLGISALQAERARVFYDSLRDVVSRWMSTECDSVAKLVKDVREEYLVS